MLVVKETSSKALQLQLQSLSSAMADSNPKAHVNYQIYFLFLKTSGQSKSQVGRRVLFKQPHAQDFRQLFHESCAFLVLCFEHSLGNQNVHSPFWGTIYIGRISPIEMVESADTVSISERNSPLSISLGRKKKNNL